MSLEIRNFIPNSGQSSVSINTDLTFDLVATDGDQIDISTLSVVINMNSNVISGDINTLTYDFNTQPDLLQIKYTGNETYYKIQVLPDFPFDENQTVEVVVNVQSITNVAMVEYVTGFTTVNNGTLTDFKYVFLDSCTKIPVYAEILRPNNSTTPTAFNSAFSNWNQKPQPIIKRNGLIISEGYTIDYKNGKINFDNATLEHGDIDYMDQITADYTFNFFQDEQLIAFMKQANAIWTYSPPFGGSSDIMNASDLLKQVIMIGGAMFAFRDLLLGLAIQEKRIIFDNESWNDGWKAVKDIFKDSYDAYEKLWEKLLEAKKLKLPGIASVVTPEFTLPGGRGRFFRYLYK